MQGLLDDKFNERKQNIMKGFQDDLSKAEGSRGGKVVGHTSGGKPIYASWNKQADSVYSNKHDDPFNGHSAKDLHEIADHHADVVRKEVVKHNTKHDEGRLNKDQYEKHGNLLDKRWQVNVMKRNAYRAEGKEPKEHHDDEKYIPSVKGV